MRGESTAQVEGAAICVVSCGESVNPTSAAILGRGYNAETVCISEWYFVF